MKKIIVGFRTPDEGVLVFLRAAPRHILVNTVSVDVCLFLRKNGINCASSRITLNRMFIEPGDIVVLNAGDMNPDVATACPAILVIDPADYAAVAAELHASATNEVSPETRARLHAKLVNALHVVS
ncbi:MAG TPA: hypothetical protein VF438_01420 [Candidatus Paceibacterota bacterium]